MQKFAGYLPVDETESASEFSLQDVVEPEHEDAVFDDLWNDPPECRSSSSYGRQTRTRWEWKESLSLHHLVWKRRLILTQVGS